MRAHRTAETGSGHPLGPGAVGEGRRGKRALPLHLPQETWRQPSPAAASRTRTRTRTHAGRHRPGSPAAPGAAVSAEAAAWVRWGRTGGTFSRARGTPLARTVSANRPCTAFQGKRATGCQGRQGRVGPPRSGAPRGDPGRRPPPGPHPALASVHGLLLEALSDLEVDLGGAHGGGRLDVELIPVLADFHVRLGRSRHRHFAQHGVHTCARKEGCATGSVAAPARLCPHPVLMETSKQTRCPEPSPGVSGGETEPQ